MTTLHLFLLVRPPRTTFSTCDDASMTISSRATPPGWGGGSGGVLSSKPSGELRCKLVSGSFAEASYTTVLFPFTDFGLPPFRALLYVFLHCNDVWKFGSNEGSPLLVSGRFAEFFSSLSPAQTSSLMPRVLLIQEPRRPLQSVLTFAKNRPTCCPPHPSYEWVSSFWCALSPGTGPGFPDASPPL